MRQIFELPYFFSFIFREIQKNKPLNKNKSIIININKLLTNHTNMK
jgi:hypothetical protein